MEKITVFIVDDHEVVRLGLAGLFAQHADLDVVGEAATGEEAIQKIGSLHPDVVLLDIRMPGIGGLETCRIIVNTVPQTKVVILTSFAEPEEVQAAFTAGASGYVLKNITSGSLTGAIRSVMKGETYLDTEVTEQVFSLIRVGITEPVPGALSAREEEILGLVAEGKTNREIGDKLFISEKTVRNHVSRILEKLKLSNRSQLAAYKARSSIMEKLRPDRK